MQCGSATNAAKYDLCYSYQNNGANVNLTGSPDYAAKIVYVGDPGKAHVPVRRALRVEGLCRFRGRRHVQRRPLRDGRRPGHQQADCQCNQHDRSARVIHARTMALVEPAVNR